MALTITLSEVRPYLPEAVALTDPDQLQRMIDVAALRLEVACPSIEARLDAEELAPELVYAGIGEVVGRVLSNPDTTIVRRVVTTGPYSESSTRVHGSDRIRWLESDLEPLRPAPPVLGVLGSARLGVYGWQVPG